MITFAYLQCAVGVNEANMGISRSIGDAAIKWEGPVVLGGTSIISTRAWRHLALQARWGWRSTSHTPRWARVQWDQSRTAPPSRPAQRTSKYLPEKGH